MNRKSRLGLIYGGWSSERDISVSSAHQVLRHLDRSRYDVVPIEIQEDRVWSIQDGMGSRETLPSVVLDEIDVALLVLHGVGGEDGVIQGLLEAHGVPSTGPGVATSAIFMDKVLSKWQFVAHGIPTPRYVTATSSCFAEDPEGLVANVVDRLGPRTVIKPACHGSSIGVGITENPGEIAVSLKTAFALDDRVLIEEFVTGTEVQVGILGHWTDYQVLPTLELDFQDGQNWFDPETKYGTDRSRITFQIPARLGPEVIERLSALASVLYERYRFTGYGRFDFLVTATGDPLLLEINTITGMTPTSTYPLMAQRAGLSYPKLLNTLLDLAGRPPAEVGVTV